MPPRPLSLALALTALLPGLALGAPPAPTQERLLSRCDAPALSHDELRDIEGSLGLTWDEAITRAPGALPSIPIAFHIIMNEAGTIGQVSDEQILLQLQVLNEAYEGCGLSFHIASTERYFDDECYVMTLGNEDECKGKIQADPYTHLNFYSATLITALGWAYFPWTLNATSERDGVVVHFSSMAGGTYEPFNLGHTGTHEVGHWVGLYHTFEGGCSVLGDVVSDTPAESTATSGCPERKDTCARGGPDPVHNFMDYSDDGCMESFSQGQCDRMDTMLRRYRGDLFRMEGL